MLKPGGPGMLGLCWRLLGGILQDFFFFQFCKTVEIESGGCKPQRFEEQSSSIYNHPVVQLPHGLS